MEGLLPFSNPLVAVTEIGYPPPETQARPANWITRTEEAEGGRLPTQAEPAVEREDGSLPEEAPKILTCTGKAK